MNDTTWTGIFLQLLAFIIIAPVALLGLMAVGRGLDWVADNLPRRQAQCACHARTRK